MPVTASLRRLGKTEWSSQVVKLENNLESVDLVISFLKRKLSQISTCGSED